MEAIMYQGRDMLSYVLQPVPLAPSDLRLILNQPPRKLGGSYFFFSAKSIQGLSRALDQTTFIHND
jgi:hypothetical protein